MAEGGSWKERRADRNELYFRVAQTKKDQPLHRHVISTAQIADSTSTMANAIAIVRIKMFGATTQLYLEQSSDEINTFSEEGKRHPG